MIGPEFPQFVEFTAIDAEGRRLYVGSCAASDIDRQPFSLVYGIMPPDHYADLTGPFPVSTPRPSIEATLDRISIAANGEDQAVLSGLPVPCRVLVNGREAMVEDGSLELTADAPARYEILIDQWPYMPRIYVVTAVVP